MEFFARAGDKIYDIETGEYLATAAKDISSREFLQPDMFEDVVAPLVGSTTARKVRARIARALLARSPNRVDRKPREGTLDG